MKKSLVLACLFFTIQAYAQSPSLAIVPQPASITAGSGSFTLPTQFSIISTKNESVKKIADQLATVLKSATGYSITQEEGNSVKPGSIALLLSNDPTINEEGYRLRVTNDGVSIQANQPAGLFFGVQTLYQLLPPEIVAKEKSNLSQWTIPVINIEDQPRFGWRGLMLDVSRHFFTVAQVKEYIDEMQKYKFNRLHLHLTDDQGWRLQIKSLPKLTEVGAWRVEKTGTFGSFSRPEPNGPLGQIAFLLCNNLGRE